MPPRTGLVESGKILIPLRHRSIEHGACVEGKNVQPKEAGARPSGRYEDGAMIPVARPSGR
jgi:hypothetical protein